MIALVSANTNNALVITKDLQPALSTLNISGRIGKNPNDLSQ